MRGRHWTEVGVITVLLLSEVVIAQLCKSPITLLDGFHTLFLLLNTLSVTNSLFSEDHEEPPTHTPQPLQVRDVDYGPMRAQPVGAFISNLVLLSLNVIYLTEICSFMLEPATAQRPLLLVATGAVSLMVKLFLLGLHLHQVRGGHTEPAQEPHIEVNCNALSAEEKGQAEQGGVVKNSELNRLNLDGPIHNTALTISNPNIPGPEELHSNGTCGQHSNDKPPPSQPKASPVLSSLQSPWSYIGETLITPFLVLVTALAKLSPVCLHNSNLCLVLVYLDPVLSLLAVFLLIAKAIPLVYRYGLLLLQSTPAHFSVDEVGKKIMDVPGVEALHELHVWRLSESFIVASVHVHCDTTLTNRCVDVMLGVTKVLQREGVSCCTIQPEFSDQEPSLQFCSLACAGPCAGSMCCSHLTKQHNITNGSPREETTAGPDQITTVY